jgi:hypothetical protein
VAVTPPAGQAANYQKVTGSGFSLDALVPVIPVKNASDRGNALTLTATFTKGKGIADLISGLSGNTQNPSSLYTSTPIDNGLLAVDAAGAFHAVEWRGVLVGAQYYLPPSGRVFVSGTYGRVYSSNVSDYVVPNAAALWDRGRYLDANLFVDVTPAVRSGLSYERVEQTYVDGVKAKNVRWQFTTCLFF